MTRQWRLNGASRVWLAATACISAGIMMAASPALAVVAITADPEFNYNGVDNIAPNVFTVDPLENPPVTATGERGVAGDRRLRQTFKNPTTFNVGEIVFGFDVTGGAEVGLRLAVYEVADVLSGTWTPLGDALWERNFTETLPGSNANLSFKLTGGDVFTLPARGNSDSAGYGIEISTPNPDSSNGNPGLVIHTNVGDTDFYADGRYYTEGGGASSAHRDLGVSLIASNESVCDPGDVDCMGGVTLDDLAIIAANFRTSNGREFGDLSGDGFVDFDDFDEWKINYSGPAPSPEQLAFLSAPEPGSLMLASLAAFAAMRTRRRN